MWHCHDTTLFIRLFILTLYTQQTNNNKKQKKNTHTTLARYHSLNQMIKLETMSYNQSINQSVKRLLLIDS